MVLMNAVFNFVPPDSTTTNLIGAAITLDDQDVSRVEPKTFKFSVHQFKFLNVL